MILYTWHDFFPDEANVLNNLLEMGISWLHIYKPYKPILRVEQLLEQIDKAFHQRLIMHFYYPLASKYNLGGIHISRYSSPIIQNNYSWISHSAHHITELEPSDRVYTHLLVSPIFDSISKHKHASQWNLDLLSEFFKTQKVNDIKYIALGGITLNNYNKVLEAGFDDAAFLGDFWMNYFKTQHLSTAYDFIKQINSYQKTGINESFN